MENLNHDVLLEVMIRMDPDSLKQLITSDVKYNQIYRDYNVYIWRSYVHRDFGQLYTAFGIDINSIGTPSPETYIKCFTYALAVLRQNALDGAKGLQYFLRLPRTLFDKITPSQWAYICRLTVKYRPDLLAELIDLKATKFYVAFSVNNASETTDYTFVILMDVQNMNNDELRKCLPYVYDAFINPTIHNPQGLFNKSYSEGTKRIISANLSRWQSITALI